MWKTTHVSPVFSFLTCHVGWAFFFLIISLLPYRTHPPPPRDLPPPGWHRCAGPLITQSVSPRLAPSPTISSPCHRCCLVLLFPYRRHHPLAPRHLNGFIDLVDAVNNGHDALGLKRAAGLIDSKLPHLIQCSAYWIHAVNSANLGTRQWRWCGGDWVRRASCRAWVMCCLGGTRPRARARHGSRGWVQPAGGSQPDVSVKTIDISD